MNYLTQRIQYLKRDREEKILRAVIDSGANPQTETDIQVKPSKEGWEDLIVKGKVALSWTTEPQVINGEIDFLYEFYNTP